MGNARFFVARSCSILEKYRLACEVLRLGRDIDVEEKKFTWMEESECGTKYWFLGNKGNWGFWCRGGYKFHRRDGPAVEWANGDKEWWVEGKRHREHGPAVEQVRGTKLYFIEGKMVGRNNK